jgi:uncharacterized protein (TIGR03067 family)
MADLALSEESRTICSIEWRISFFRHGVQMMLLGLMLAICGGLDWQAIADATRIQGTWKVVSVRHDGMSVPTSDWNYTSITFSGDEVKLERLTRSDEGKFLLRSFQVKPCECDFSLYVHKGVNWSGWKPTRYSLAALTMGYGIYEFDGDRLRICVFLQGVDCVTKRPKEFAARWNDSQWLYLLKRE